jgi:lysophospholipase L1-like esterase
MKEFVTKLAKSAADPKGSPPVTIAFLGDSVTCGCFEIYKTPESEFAPVYDCAEAYPYKLERLIRTVFPSAKLNIVNAGVSGDNAAGGLARLERDVLAFNPDLAVVCFGLNDVNGGKTGADAYADTMGKIFGRLAERGIPRVFLTPNMLNTESPYTADPAYKSLYDSQAGLQNGGVMDLYMQKAVQMAIDAGALVCDVYLKWKSLHSASVNTTALLCNGVNHPSRKMHWLFAASLFDTIFFAPPPRPKTPD